MSTGKLSVRASNSAKLLLFFQSSYPLWYRKYKFSIKLVKYPCICPDMIEKMLALIIIIESRNEPPHEKTNNLHMRKQRRRSVSGNREADQRLCFHYMDSTIPVYFLNPKFPVSSHL